MKKLLIFTFVFAFAFHSIGFAAIGGSKPRMSAPRPAAPTQQVPKNTSDYKPSAPANSYSEKAPAAKTATPQAAQQPNTGSGFMRNLGMIGGGMLLGGMLGSLFGDSPFLASLFGMLANVLILAGIFLGGRYLWNKLKAKPKTDEKDSRRF
jgi:predicted lipid-binding transport protein (Tim44 family)